MTLTDHMIDSTAELPYNTHIFLGFAVGILTSAITEHLDDIILTFILGCSSALGAGLIKSLLSWAKKLNAGDKIITNREKEQTKKY